MSLLHRLSSFRRTLFHRASVEQELDEELRAHVQLLVDEKLSRGMDEASARRASLIEVGGIEQVKEQVREVRVGAVVETIWQDLRYGMRALSKSRSFTFA